MLQAGSVLALEPGDRGITAVERWPEVASQVSGTCARCGRAFPPSDAWRVDYRDQHDNAYRFVVCPTCADELEPVRVTIDLTALERRRLEVDLAPIVTAVRWIVDHRAEPPTGELTLRATDVYILAQAYGEEPQAFADRMHEAGVTAGA